MTLRAVIVDDEPPARRRLRALLRAEPSIDVIGDADDGPAAVAAIEQLQPDLVFLDVQMPGLDGFDVLEEIIERRGAQCPAVIFVTAHDAHALRAFGVHAVDYLLKPFDRARLHTAIERAVRLAGDAAVPRRLAALAGDATSRRPLRRFMVRSGGRISFVAVDEVDCVEAAGHYVSLRAGRQTHLVRDTITSVAERLDPQRFARIHRGALVNLERIRELRPLFHGEFEVLLKDGTRLRATRTFAAALTRALSG